MSTIFNMMHQGQQVQQAPNQNGINPQIFQNLQTFASTLNGNPEQIVRSLLQSGRMSQGQFNTLGQQASQIQQQMMQMMRGF